VTASAADSYSCQRLPAIPISLPFAAAEFQCVDALVVAVLREAAHLVPQAERLLRRIEGLELPLIELWGWPGSGSSAVLQVLLGRHDVAGLALADLAVEATARAALTASEARLLVVAGDPAERLDDLASWLRPGQQLVFASRRRRTGGPLAVALLPPQELLLTAPEVARLWHLICGKPPGASTAQALWRATDGWFRPLRLALEATGGAGLESATAEQLLEIPPVRLFLRHEVLDALEASERDQLLAAARDRPSAGDGGGRAEAAVRGESRLGAWQVVEDLGLWVEGGERDRLPALLAACLERERRRRHPRAAAGGDTLPASGGAATRQHGPARTGGMARPGNGQNREAAGAAGEIPAAHQAYQVRLFGGPTVRQLTADGEREVGWKLRRSFQVLAFLASSPDMQAGREDLEEAVWPSDGERTIDRNFHPTLSHLRRALERQRRSSAPPLLFRAGIYRLNPEIEWHIDLQDWRRLVAQGRELVARGEEAAAADTWQRAWKLYRGPFLQGYYQAWVTARREECQQAYVELLRDLGDLSVRIERSEDALDAYRTVLLEDPLQERTHLAVMRLYAGQGRRDLVRRQYERLCTLLLDELGVEPLPETVQEYHRLMS
jgi:DNA-binding SARP family transcriptional activator